MAGTFRLSYDRCEDLQDGNSRKKEGEDNEHQRDEGDYSEDP